MLLDAFLQVSDEQAITATAVSTNSVDLGVSRDIGEGEQLFLIVTIDEAFNTLTSLDLEIITDDAATLASSPVAIESKNVLLANLTLGAKFIVPVPPQIGSKGERYLGARYTVTGSNPSTGKITASFGTGYDDPNKFYASGFTIL